MAFWDKEESLLIIDKNTKEKIEVKKVELKGKGFIDIRTLFKDDAGEYKPSSKGIAIPADKFEEIVNAVQSNVTEETPE